MTANPVTMRAFAETDLDQVLRLHGEVFGSVASQALARRWAWSQVDNLCPDHTPKWVLDAEGAIVGFLATVPIPYRIGDRRVMTHSPCDFMVADAYKFHGIKLLRECFKTCESTVSLDDIDATIAVSKYLKAQLIGTMHRRAKLLDARLALRRWPRLQALPSLLWQAGRLGLALGDLPCSLRVPTVEPYSGTFDARFDRLFARCLAAEPLQATVERDSRYLRWRYGPQSPQAQRVVGVAEANGELAGYVVCCTSHDDERTGFILELVTAPDAGSSLIDGLVAFAVHELRQQGAWAVRWYLLEAEAEDQLLLLRRWGFRRRSASYELLSKLANPSTQRQVWRQQFGDAEASHGSVL